MSLVALIDARNERLDALGQAVTQWAEKRQQQLRRQVSLCRRVLKGRQGSERLTTASVSAASELVVDEIEEFLTGG